MKVDITKAFDNLSWDFLLKVLKTFGFNDIFYSWIFCILQSSNVSFSINGRLHDYFNCQRGVR